VYANEFLDADCRDRDMRMARTLSWQPPCRADRQNLKKTERSDLVFGRPVLRGNRKPSAGNRGLSERPGKGDVALKQVPRGSGVPVVIVVLVSD
jgi:hypothetical protein